MIGTRVEKYEILEEIGQGGMASVYRALDTKLKREVAIKILHAHLARQTEAVERFQREAVTVAGLSHPNIIDIYDYSGESSQYRFIVTELIDGMTLAEFVKRIGPIPCELAACIAREICQALAHAHSENVIHRDLKPENLMIRSDGKIKLMDFGIARVLEGANLTLTGAILGSPSFMSPEQIVGRKVDRRSDLFSLGCILYHMATGRLPFAGKNPHEILKHVVDGEYLPPQQIDERISNGYARIVDRLLNTDPEARYPDAEQLLADLEGLIERAEISEPTREVHDLFASPVAHIAGFNANLARRLERKALGLARGNPARAMQLLNRLLAVAPEHPDARRMIARLLSHQNSRRRMAWIGLVGGLLLIAALLAGGLVARYQPQPPPLEVYPSEPQASFPEETTPAPAPTPEPEPQKKPVAISAAKPNAAREPIRRQEPAPTPKGGMLKKATPAAEQATQKAPAIAPDASGTLKVVSMPWADIYINGKKVGNYPMHGNRAFALSPGKNTVRLVNPMCAPYSETIMVTKPGQQEVIRQRLMPQGYLKVENDQAATVFVNGKLKGTTPIAAPIPIRWSGRESSHPVRVSITKAGYKPVSREVTIVAGKTVDLPVTLVRQESDAP